MKLARKHKSKSIFARYLDGAYWEEWHLRFNRGGKKSKPVKFFASRIWRSSYEINACPFCATHFDFADERTALSSLVEQLAAHGGEILDVTPTLARLLSTEFGYVPGSKSCQ